VSTIRGRVVWIIGDEGRHTALLAGADKGCRMRFRAVFEQVFTLQTLIAVAVFALITRGKAQLKSQH
jgi:hypothetical protein